MACSSGDDSAGAGEGGAGNGSPGSGADAERFAMDAFEVIGAGELLQDPEQDDSVSITSSGGGDLVVLEPGATLTVSIPFQAENGNVVGAGIRFGDTGPIVTVPMPSMMGATAGTLTFDVQVPDDLCDELGRICHDIRCYEFAVTDAGLVSAANLQAMSAACGECTDPSCVGVLDGCEVELPDTPADFCPAPEAETIFMGGDTPPALAVDDAFLYFALDDDLVRLPKDGSGTPEVLVPDLRPSQVFPVGDTLYVRGLAQFDAVPKIGGEPELIGYASGAAITDGEAIFAGAHLACINPGDITRLDFDGTTTVLVAEELCVRSMAVDDTHLYWLGRVDEDNDHVMRVLKSGGTPEEVVAPTDMRGPLAVDDSYVYYWGGEDTFMRPLMRAPKAGGSASELVPELAAGALVHDPADGSLYFTDFAYDGCHRRVDPDGTVSAIASKAGFGEDVALDDMYFYAATYDIDLNPRIVRSPKR